MNPLVIVGAGPAGLAAATTASAHGAPVLLLDENQSPGGRIWQSIEHRTPKSRDDHHAQVQVAAFRQSGAQALFDATVWAIEDRTVFWSQASQAHTTKAGEIILAPGTTERPLPIPGWTLPGVMTVGAAQILLKTAALIPQGQTWVAGQGPLLLLYLAQALEAGGHIAGVLDLSDGHIPPTTLPGALLSPGALARAATWRRRIAAAQIPWVKATNLQAWGTTSLERIGFRANNTARIEPADTLLLHDGVIPALHLPRALGCAHEWDHPQRCWRPTTNQWGQTCRPGIAIAGDAAGVGGWQAAAYSGQIAALAALTRMGHITPSARDHLARPALIRRRRRLALRPLLDALYPPLDLPIADTTIVCRCEEVTAAQIRQAATLGCLGLNQLKAFTRAGMGPCQSRLCAPTLARILAQARHVDEPEIEPLRLRFPTKPLTLGELAALDTPP